MSISFEYIAPREDGKHDRYIGFEIPVLGEKQCRKEIRKDIDWNVIEAEWDMWLDNIYELKDHRSVDANTEEQRWERTMLYEDETFTSWNITYFKEEGYAIPNTKFQEVHTEDGLKWIDRLKFAYEEPINKMNAKLPSFCK